MREEPLPTRLGALWFALRSRGLQMRRALRNLLQGMRRHPRSGELCAAPVCGEWKSDLWQEEGAAGERRLELGKVQNLRAAVHRLHGTVVPAGGLWSFWKEVGRATPRRGFAIGRELREGCVIPSLGGGLCQLSGALYNAALAAGLEVVERHRHTQAGVSRLARTGRDATVFWNYVDLRLRAPFAWRLEARLSADQLIVSIRAPAAPASVPAPALPRVESTAAHAPEACDTCGAEACFRHVRAAVRDGVDRTAVLVDEYWPEHADWLGTQPFHLLLRPLDGRRWRRASYAWEPAAAGVEVQSATFTTLQRAFATRRLAQQGARRQRALLAWDERLARAYARQLRPEHSHLIVAQTLLPFLWREGVLGGRTFDVLMTRMPIADLEAALDAAARDHPESRTCADFRAPAALREAETEALAAAGSWITPHLGIAALAGARARVLPWRFPPPVPRSGENRKRIVFPASALCRKGAYEVRAAARELELEVACLGDTHEGAGFWHGVRLAEADTNWISNAAAVVLPAYVEHRPRRLLAALASGVPVIATAACGVPGATLVPAGDAAALTSILNKVPDPAHSRPSFSAQTAS